VLLFFFFFSSRRRHTRSLRDWSSDVCSSDLDPAQLVVHLLNRLCPQSLLLAQLVEAEIDDNPRHPGHETGFALKLLQSLPGLHRSEERRVGKECRSRWWRCITKKNRKAETWR